MDIQQTLMNLVQNYYGVLVVLIGFGVYAIFERQSAKRIILGLMLQIEKSAETLALATGDAKFQFLVDKGYALLPQGARIFITPAMFTTLAQSLYDEAKKLLTQPQQTVEPTIPVDLVPIQPVTPVVEPTQPVQLIQEQPTPVEATPTKPQQ